MMMITAHPDEPVLRLPTRPLLAIGLAVPLLCGALAAAALLLIGRWGSDPAWGALAGGGVIAATAVLGTLVIGPWKERPIGIWMSLWMGGTIVRLVVAPGLTYLLYSATSLSPLALSLTVAFTYLITLLAEVYVLAGHMNRTTTATAAGSTGTSPGGAAAPMVTLAQAFIAADNPIDHVTDKILVRSSAGTPIITMHMVTLVCVAIVFVLVMMRVAKAITTGPESEGNERYTTKGRLAQMIEAMICYLRDEMLAPVLGEATTRKYLPFLMTVFFFILFQNVFGLIPIIDLLHLVGFQKTWIGGTATANIMVTGALSIFAFVLIQMHGFKELGVKGWLVHNFGGLVPGPIFLMPVALLVFVVELAGHLIKPAALAIRLFANMVAGHTLMAVLAGFGAMAAKAGTGFITIGSVTLVSGVAAVAITFLELFVAFLQAFIFMFLTAVFISLLSHHDEDHEHDHEHGEAGAEAVPAH